MNKISTRSTLSSAANRVTGKLVVAGLLGMTVAGTSVVDSANAQDLLPRDNGIYTYYKAPRWRESESHPLRTVSYIFHPVGWLMREGIYRPMSYLISSTPFTKSFFGYREPFDFREPECFFNTDVIPDCRQLAPMNEIYPAPREGVEPTAGDEASLNSSERSVYFPDVAFDFDKANLNQLGKARVRQVSQLLATVPNLKVVVEGHTDYKGTDEYNMKLGSRRAEAVVKELSELGVDPSRMTPVSFGEGKPLFTEDTDWARAANRRVQFSVNSGATAVAADSGLAPAKQ